MHIKPDPAATSDLIELGTSTSVPLLVVDWNYSETRKYFVDEYTHTM